MSPETPISTGSDLRISVVRKVMFRDQGAQQNRLARSPVSLEVGSNRGTCATDVQLSHAGLIIVEEAVDEDYTIQKP